MGQLEGRAEAISGEFNSQDVANTLWACCVFSSVCLEILCHFCGALSSRFMNIDFDDLKTRGQMHQVFMAYDLVDGLHAGFS
jgi:hypothetical protein